MGHMNLQSKFKKLQPSYIDVRDRGVKTDKFQVLIQTEMPSVLVECGFLTNTDEAKKLKDKSYQEILAEGNSSRYTYILRYKFKKNKGWYIPSFFDKKYITLELLKKNTYIKVG